jgi:hypothetical protein
MEVTLVLPAHNEEKRLAGTLAKSARVLGQVGAGSVGRAGRNEEVPG